MLIRKLALIVAIATARFSILAEAEDVPDPTAPTTQEILLQLFADTGGLRWTNGTDTWFQVAGICNYYGITCYSNSSDEQSGHIQALELTDNHLKGTFPTEVYQLPYLQRLDLGGNTDLVVRFAGIEQAQYLEELIISSTATESLEGIDQAVALKEFQLTNLALKGTFPTQLLQLTGLQSLVANFNEFSGPLPPEVGNWIEMTELYLYENNLSGQIPTTIGNLVNIRSLNLGQNSFVGTLPTELSVLANLDVLWINRDQGTEKGAGISGPLPKLDGLTSISQLYLQNQKLDSTIPEGFLAGAQSQDSIIVDLSGNQLTNPLPNSLIAKKRINLILANNNFTSLDESYCAQVPSWLGGDVGAANGCDGLLCPAGTWTPTGRQTGDSDVCEPCSGAEHAGTTQCFTTSTGAVNEFTILENFYEQMGGQYWQENDKWLNDSEDVCTWFGVTCANGAITEISLGKNGLTGEFPTQIYLLPSLKVLDLSFNSFKFHFSGISNAANLELLDLTATDLDSLDNVDELINTNIQHLLLASNNVEGYIPTSLFSISSLEELDVSDNLFSGPLPSELSQLTNLVHLVCFANSFSGTVPTQLGQLTKLVDIYCGGNDWTGVLPEEIDALTSLENLSLYQSFSSNNIAGFLPSYSQLEQLILFDLAGNALSGTLPEDFLSGTKRGSERVEILLASNEIVGTIPSSWGSRFSHLILDLTDNRISGFGEGICDQSEWMHGDVGSLGCDAILCPKGTFSELGRQTSIDSDCESCSQASFLGSTSCGSDTGNGEIDILQELYSATNGDGWSNSNGWKDSNDVCSWHGVVCDSAGKVAKLNLGGNGLIGDIPSSIYKLESLGFLNFEQNQISISFTGIGQASNLQSLVLSKTGLDSVAGLGEAVGLRELFLADNNLQGTFPSDILQLTGLTRLFLNFNNIEGRLPDEIKLLSDLEELYLFNNRLTGWIPGAIGELSKLRSLLLSENNFSGSLPAELNDLSNLEFFAAQAQGQIDPTEAVNVDTNQGDHRDNGIGLSGPLLALDKLPKIRELYLGMNSISGTIPDNFLDGVEDKTIEIRVDLISNKLVGTIPSSLARFDAMTIYLADNKISAIPDGLCSQSGWMGGGVGSFGCDAILCKPGYASQYGRQAGNSSVCTACATNYSTDFFGSFSCLDAQSAAVADEKAVLEQLFRALNGENWRGNMNWLDDDVSICSWQGITCKSDEEESVQAIHLMNNGLSGTVPASIFSLSNLQELNLASNDIQMSFTGSGQARSLQYLDLDSTGLRSLQGIESVQSLKLLHAADCEFGGSFPTAIFSVSTLQVIDISRNDIGSTLPGAFQNLTNLKYLSCSQCGLEGSIPTSLVAITELQYLRLDMNSFSGSIPEELNSLSSLKHLDLSDQMSAGKSEGLSGGLPSFAGFSSLVELYLSDNRLNGTIPSSFLQDVSTNFVPTVDLNSNQLSGTLPSELSRFNRLNIYLGDNEIEAIPEELCSLQWNGKSANDSNCEFILCDKNSSSSLGRASNQVHCTTCDGGEFLGRTSCGPTYELDILTQMYRDLGGQQWIYRNGWTVSNDICSWFGITCYNSSHLLGKVESIDLRSNNLVGTLSSDIWKLSHLVNLNLRENDIDVSFATIGDASSLTFFDMSETKVQSLSGIGGAASLQYLSLTNNNIAGSIPDEIYDLSALQTLLLNYNAFNGTISSKIGQLSNLQELYLFHNKLTGQLPDSLTSPNSMRILSLGGNNFEGTIPTALSTMQNLEVLSLQQNQLKSSNGSDNVSPRIGGRLPAFESMPNLRELYLGGNFLSGTIPSNFLSAVNDKTATVRVDLTHNSIHGSIPESLTAFHDLRLLVADNKISDIPPEICNMTNWMNGLLASGCDALLCSPRTFNDFGRRTKTEECKPCDYVGAATSYGAITCDYPDANNVDEKEVLKDLFEATMGSGWQSNTNWLSTSLSVCNWKGVTCETDASGKSVVAGLNLRSNKLKGRIPSTVYYLSSLRVLDLADNDISIGFSDIRKAESLEELYIESTNVDSVDGLAQATNLRVLNMEVNSFKGKAFPEDLAKLTRLEKLDISNCGFAGPLPDGVGMLSSLQLFDASYNDFSGVIPDSIRNLSSLRILKLGENNFFGTLPGALQQLTRLESLKISGRTRKSAGLSGPLPPFLYFPYLLELDLGSNSLTGTVPSNFLNDLENKTSRIEVLLDSNLLQGGVPSTLSQFSRLNLDLAGNEITSIDGDLCDLSQWWDGDVGRFHCDAILCRPGTFNAVGRYSSNVGRCESCPGEENSKLYGQNVCPALQKEAAKNILELLYKSTGGDNWNRKDGWMKESVDICEWYGVTCKNQVQIDSLILGANNLIGTPPKEIFQLPGLRVLWLYSNSIDFSFEGIEYAMNLASIQLDSTGLSSLEGIGKARSLRDVNVRFNSLKGRLPQEISELSNLETFFCGDNYLSGSLPSFEQNRKLVQLRVGSNAFTGQLPSFANHPSITTLDISENKFHGEIPDDLFAAADSSNPIFLNLAENFLSGEVPGSLQRFPDMTLYVKDNRITSVSPQLCGQLKWNGGDIGVYGCDGILCPPKSYSPIGRASQNEAKCVSCDQALYFGTSQCGKYASSSSTLASAFALSLMLTNMIALY